MITVVVVIITNAFVVVSSHLVSRSQTAFTRKKRSGYARLVRTPAAQASEVLRNGNPSKLYSYISVRNNILAISGCPLHRTIFGLAISANPTIVGRKMTEIVRAR